MDMDNKIYWSKLDVFYIFQIVTFRERHPIFILFFLKRKKEKKRKIDILIKDILYE
jgi:hypothetical protein